MMDYCIPAIDEAYPLPTKATNTEINLTPREEVEMRGRTIKLLAELSNRVIQPTEEDKANAQQLAVHVNETGIDLDLDKFSEGTYVVLVELVKAHSTPIVPNLSDLKTYIVNKLIFEIEYSKSSKDRIAAIKSLGEVDGVDAFKKRTENTLIYKPLEEVEKELLTVLDNIEYTVVNSDEDLSAIDNSSIYDEYETDQEVTTENLLS